MRQNLHILSGKFASGNNSVSILTSQPDQ